MEQKVKVSVRVNPELKQKANDIYKDLGIDMSTAVNILLKATVRERSLPLNMSLLPKDTQEAVDDANNHHNLKSYDSVADLMKELTSDKD